MSPSKSRFKLHGHLRTTVTSLPTAAKQAATVAYLGAALLLVLALFGFIHAFRTPKDKGFAVVPDTVEDIEKLAKV